MTVIRAPDDDDDLDDGVLQAEATESGVSKAVGRSIKYIKRVLGMKAARKRRKPRYTAARLTCRTIRLANRKHE